MKTPLRHISFQIPEDAIKRLRAMKPEQLRRAIKRGQEAAANTRRFDRKIKVRRSLPGDMVLVDTWE